MKEQLRIRRIKESVVSLLLFTEKGYAHVAHGKITVNGDALEADDALKTDGGTIDLKDGKDVEVLVFDLLG